MKQVQAIKSVEERNIFRLLRIARNLKVADIADALSVTYAYINAIENGTRYPSDRLLRDYAIVLDVDEEIIRTFNPDTLENTRFENLMLHVLQLII